MTPPTQRHHVAAKPGTQLLKALVALACAVPFVQPSLGQTPPKPQLAFASDRTGRLQIHTVQPDPLGSVAQRTFEGSAGQEARAPDWSRFGRIAYQFGASGVRSIHRINADGSDHQRLTLSGKDERDPSWSPDGMFIVYASNENGTYDLWIHDVTGATDYLLIASTRDQLRPSWSPDGNWIAYVSNEDLDNEIMVIPVSVVDGNVVAGSPAPKTSNTDNDFNPCWSPDSSSIAFQSTRGGNTDIYRMDLASGEASIMRLTIHSGSDSNPAWSPDGGTVAFVSDRDGNSEIYVMSATSGEADVTALRRITNDAGQDVDPAWEPQEAVDIVAVSLAWNNTIGGVEARYQVHGGGLAVATTVKLFWANGTSINDILTTVPIHVEPIPAGIGSSGSSGVITFNVSAASISTPVPGATHILLVIDSDNLVQESNEANNVLPLLILQCEPGTQFINVLLPEILVDIPLVKVARLKLRFAPLGLNFQVQDANDPGALCEAQSNVGTLTLSVLRIPIVGQIEERVFGYSTSQATLTLFQDGRVRWRVPAFDVTVAPPYCIPLCLFNKSLSVGSLEEWVTAADLGFSPLGVPFEMTVRRAEYILHQRLSTSRQILSWLTRKIVWEDPGETDLLVTSPTGEQSGMMNDGTVVENIPGGIYFPAVPLIIVFAPDEGDFQVDVRARTPGDYLLLSAFSDASSVAAQQSFAGTFASAGETASYSTPVPPSLRINRISDSLTISWSLTVTNFLLEASSTLRGDSWFTVQDVTANSALVPISSTNRFFRLRRK